MAEDEKQQQLEKIVGHFYSPAHSGKTIEVMVDHRHITHALATFLHERDYLTSDFIILKESKLSQTIKGYFDVSSSTREKRCVLVTIKKSLFDGYAVTLEDQDESYVCPADLKYEFKFLKKGRAVEMSEGEFRFDPHSIFVSYTQKDKNSKDESWFSRSVYGKNRKELRNLHEAMPEMKYAINRHLLNLVAETVLNFTTLARVIKAVGGDAWMLWLSGASTVSKIPAERTYSRKAAEITSGLPLASYSHLIDSPHNVINRIVERRDVASWRRLEESLEYLASEAELTEEEADIGAKILQLERLLQEPDAQEKIKAESKHWNIESSPRLEETLQELTLIDYDSIRKQLKSYTSELEARGLLKPDISADEVIDNGLKLFPGRYASELRRHLFDMFKSLIRSPTQEEYGGVLRNVKHQLEKNVRRDMSIFLGYYPLAYVADSRFKVPLLGYVSYYIALEVSEYYNHSGFERLNTVIDLHYIIKELDNDPTIASGADAINQYRSHLTKVSAFLYPVLLGLAVTGEYFSSRTGGISNYVMDVIAFTAKYASMKQWHKFMDSLIERCEKKMDDNQ